MNRISISALLGALALSGCVAPTGPVEVTRFHRADLAPLERGSIAIEAMPGSNGSSLEFASYASAVARQLVRLGYTEAASGSGTQVAYLRLDRHRYRPERHRSPVSVGVGGSTGSYGSGIGLGLGIDLSGRPPEQVETELAVTIKPRTAGTASPALPLWEGRAHYTVRADSPLADSQLGAARLAEALFSGFPGRSGETIEVK